MLRDDGFPSSAASLAELRQAVLGLLDHYQESAGRSADDYDAAPRVHPMAEGKYLLACAELADTGLLAASAAQRRAGPVLERLAAHDVGSGRRSCWGLGFSFRGLPDDEPYTITTAIVVRGLGRIAPHLRGGAREACDTQRERAVEWLLSGVPRVDLDGAAAPAYSPGLRVAPFNVAAAWCAALVEALPGDDERLAEVRTVAASVDGAHVDLAGWPYDPASSRVDLVHNCYVGGGLLAALPDRRSDVARRLLTTLSQFGGGATWFDGYDVRPTEEVLRAAPASAFAAVRVQGARALVGFHRRARAWSVGEALVLLGELSTDAVVGDLAFRQLRGLAGVALRDYLPETRHRHGMHLAHGLSTVLRCARDRAQPAL